MPSWSASQFFTCVTLLGFSSPVMAMALSVSSALYFSSIATALMASLRSMRTPRSLMRASRHQKSCSRSVGAQRESILRMALSATTSCPLYFLNVSHFSGACSGRLRVRIPLVLVGLQGWQKYRMSALPSFILAWSSPRPSASLAPARLMGRPHCPARIMLSSHCSGGQYTPHWVRMAFRSNAQFHAALVTAGLVRSNITVRGTFSPAVRSMTVTSSSS